MDQFMADAGAYGAATAPVTMGVTEAVKAMLGPEFPSRFIPMIAIAIPMTVGTGIALLAHADWRLGLAGGLISGVGANAGFIFGKWREAASMKFQ